MTHSLNIHVEGSASVSRTADCAVFHISITAQGTSWERATEAAEQETKNLTSGNKFNVKILASSLLPGDTSSSPSSSTAQPQSSSSTGGLFTRTKDTRQQQQQQTQSGATAAISTTVTLTASLQTPNPASLSTLHHQAISTPHVTLREVDWHLAEATRAEMEAEARRKALEDAVRKADAYAAVVGRRVVAVDIKEGPVSCEAASVTYAAHHHARVHGSYSGKMSSIAASGFGSSKAVAEPIDRRMMTISAKVNVRFAEPNGEPVEG